MREIKFRAWEKSKKHWVDFNIYPGIFHKGYKDPHMLELFSDDCEISQFTGLKDINGKEVFEGDIVNDDVYGYGVIKFGKHEALGQDYYSNLAYGWYIQFKSDLDQKALHANTEVIGNIYENKDLV